MNDDEPQIIMIEEEKDPPYTLEELIKTCKKIRDDGDGAINLVRSIYTLAIEIKAVRAYLEFKDLADVKRSKNDMVLVCNMINKIREEFKPST